MKNIMTEKSEALLRLLDDGTIRPSDKIAAAANFAGEVRDALEGPSRTVKRRFLIFAGAQYYPGKGWQDFKGWAATLEDALEAAANVEGDWWQIIDMDGPDTGMVVKEGQRNYK